MPGQEPAPLSVRAYRRVAWGRSCLRRGGDAVFAGGFLGLMDRDDLIVVDRAFYAVASESVDGTPYRYTDRQHFTSGLASWEVNALDTYFPQGARILVTGAGAGRELRALLERGFDAIGYEPNEQLAAPGAVALAAEGRAGLLRNCRRDEFPADAPDADGVVVGWGSYMLIAGRQRRVMFLAGARDRLPLRAPLLLSFFERPPSRYFDVVHRIAATVRWLRRAEPVELGDALVPNFVHYFSRAEITSELAEAGFELVHYSSNPYAHAVARVASECE